MRERGAGRRPCEYAGAEAATITAAVINAENSVPEIGGIGSIPAAQKFLAGKLMHIYNVASSLTAKPHASLFQSVNHSKEIGMCNCLHNPQTRFCPGRIN